MTATRTTAKRSAVVATCLALLALAGCGGSGSSDASADRSASAASATPSPLPTATPAPSPDDGACYRLAYADAVADTSAATPITCRRPHTAETFAVGRLDTLVHGHLLAVDSSRVHDQVATTCPQRLPGFLGGTTQDQQLSMIASVWFTPTVQQSEAGADWYRCDAVVLSGSEQLATDRGSLKGVLDSSEGRSRFAMCGTDEPGSADFTRVLCPDPKATWKAISVVDLAGRDYPGVDQAKAAGQTPCKDAGRNVAADPLTFKWAYEYPTAQDWAAGQHYGRCWAPTS